MYFVKAARSGGTAPEVRLARVFDDVGACEGARVLVDRLWPRGLRRDDPRIGSWMRDLAPSTEVRKRFHADREAYSEFRDAYRDELRHPARAAELAHLHALSRDGLTLTTAAREPERSHLPILVELLREQVG